MFFDLNGAQPSTSTWNTSASAFGNNYRNERKTSVCRLCANLRDVMHPIYENKEQQWNISEKINKYLPIVVSPSDQLSQMICDSCLQMLIAWDQFTQQCTEVDAKLKKEAEAVQQKVEQINATSTNDSNDATSLSVQYNDIKTVITEYLKTLQIEENNGDLTIMCQIRACASKKTSTVNSFILHMIRVHSTELGNRSDIEKFVKDNVTFEESLLSDSEGHSYSDTGSGPTAAPAPEQPRRTEPEIPCFCCPFCESGFSVKTRLLTHLKTHDIDVELEQGVTCCGQLHGKQAFIQHLQERHESSRARPPGAPWCRSCGFTARDDAHLQRHIRDNHQEKKRRKPKPPRDDDKNQKSIPAVCPECNKTLSNKYNMTAHFRRHHGAGAGTVRHVCDQCGKSYSTAGNLRLHAARAHGSGEARAQFVCPRCGERFDTLIGRESHLALHTGARPHPCRFCDKSYRTRDALVRHMDVHLDVRRHTCAACGRGFRKRSHLVAHEATHAAPSSPSASPSSGPCRVSEDDGEIDEAYGQFYAALVALRDHYARAHGIVAPDSGEPSDCGVDEEPDERGPDPHPDLDAYDDLSRSIGRGSRGEEAARARAAVHAARRLVAGRELYECSACGARLAAPHTFLHHLRIHTGERPAVCHVCGKTFRTSHALRRHLAETHERRRRRACPRCARTFANSQNLRQHLRIHTGERPHVCPAPGCDKRFTQSGSLHAHLKTHSPRMPFACCSCGARFRLRAGLVRHAARHAGEGAGASRAHACSHCDAAFRTRRARATHERRAHLPLEPAFPMHSVGKSTSNGIAAMPARVTRDAGGRRRATCGVCSVVVALAGWRRHARRHAAAGAGAGGTACAHCGRVFSEAGNLARHVRARHGPHARPHACSECGRAFSRAEHLREHAALHAPTRAFLCAVCGRSCRSAAALRVHGAVHARRHGCTTCGAVFARASQLANHSQRARCVSLPPAPVEMEKTEEVVARPEGVPADAGPYDPDDVVGTLPLPDLADYFDYFS